MNTPPNTSWAIITAAVIGVLGTLGVEFIKKTAPAATPQASSEQVQTVLQSLTPTKKEVSASVSAPQKVAHEPQFPDISGEWFVETFHEDSAYKPFVGLRIRYKMKIEQDGSALSIEGLKVGDMLDGREDFYGMDRQTPIRLSGNLQKDVDGSWMMLLTGTEDGALRKNMPIEAKVHAGTFLWKGEFSADAASGKGACVWIPGELFEESSWEAASKLLGTDD